MSCSFLPAKKNIQNKILVPVCFMLHSTILKQQQKDKTKYTEGMDSVVIMEFGIVQVSLAWERPSEFNTESSDSEDPEGNKEILF